MNVAAGRENFRDPRFAEMIPRWSV